MSDLDEATERILARANKRYIELNQLDENSHSADRSMTRDKSDMLDTTPTKHTSLTGISSSALEKQDSFSRELERDKESRRSRFSALAATLDEYAHDDYAGATPVPKTKESYKKGTSPRLSFGETRPGVLFTPAAGRSPLRELSPSKPISPTKTTRTSVTKLEIVEEERRIRFANPIASHNESTTSTSYERTLTTGTFSPREVTEMITPIIGEEEEYGLETFAKKSPSKSRNTSSSNLVCSPKPYSPSTCVTTHSPVQFNPKTSSPIVAESRTCITRTIPLDISSISPAKTVFGEGSAQRDVLTQLERAARSATDYASSPSQITPSSARHFFAQIPTTPPRRLDASSPHNSPTRTVALSSARASTVRKELEEKLRRGQAGIPRGPMATPSSLPAVRSMDSRLASAKQQGGETTPTRQEVVKTQWRGASGTPVVVGADRNEKTRPDVRAANIANLRNRWEFSTSTGTPLHPDKSAAALSEEYQKESEKMAFEKKTTTPRMKRREVIDYEQRDGAVKSRSSSPAGKSPRMSFPDSGDADSDMPSGESDDEDDRTEEASRIIDAAFDFMPASTTPNKAKRLSEEWLAESERKAREEEEERRRSWERQEEMERQETQKAAREAQKAAARPAPIRDQDEEDNAAMQDSAAGLAHTVSFYRKRRAETVTDKRGSRDAISPQQIVGAAAKSRTLRDREEIRAEESRLQKAIIVQQEQITQASRALSFCRQTQFRGSREEVDAQRALLIASETRRSLLKEIENVRNDVQPKEGPRGAMAISSITVNLARDVNGGTIGSAPDGTVYYFIVLIRNRAQVHHTALLSSDDAFRKKGTLEFAQYLRLEQLPPDFSCAVEVWGLRFRREDITHEDKFKLKGSTIQKKKKGVLSSLLPGGGSSAGDSPSEMKYLPNPNDTAFTMLGRLALDINSVDRRKFVLQDAMHPLEGTIQLKIKRHAMEKGNVLHRGFLSLYQRIQDQGSWTRYWCVLENGEMKFWRYPEDETTKDWVVLIDLSTCASNGVQQEAELSSFPNSFHVDVWVPSGDDDEAEDGRHSKKSNVDRLRVMIAADCKEDLTSWLAILNSTIKNHLMWANAPKH